MNERWVGLKGSISSQGHTCWVSTEVTLGRYKVAAVLFLWRTARVLFLGEHCVSSWCESPVHCFLSWSFTWRGRFYNWRGGATKYQENSFLLPTTITLGMPLTTIDVAKCLLSGFHKQVELKEVLWVAPENLIAQSHNYCSSSSGSVGNSDRWSIKLFARKYELSLPAVSLSTLILYMNCHGNITVK